MKPITEHSKFTEASDVVYQAEPNNLKKYAIYFFNYGALIAQQILSEEHDREMEEFDIWRDKNGFHRNKWGQYDNGKQLHNFEMLLTIFRKERENG